MNFIRYLSKKSKKSTTPTPIMDFEKAHVQFKGTHPDSLYRIPSRTQNSSNSNSINSTNHTNFWKAGSESPMTYSTSSESRRRRRHEIYRHLKDFWTHGKWPILLILGCLLLGIIIFILVIDQNQKSQSNVNNISNSHNQFIASNFSSKREISSETIRTNQAFENQNHYKPISKIKTTPTTLQTPTATTSTKRPTSITENEQEGFITTEIVYETDTTIKSTRNRDPEVTTLTPHRNTQILKIFTKDATKFDEDLMTPTTESFNKDKKLDVPTKETLQIIGFTSGHQNNFGVPIEEDERILKILNEELIRNGYNETTPTTDSSFFKTRVSPTLPVIYHGESTTEAVTPKSNISDVGVCESTSLSICRGILHYDLTTSRSRKHLSPTDLEHFKYLLASKCSLRAAEFVCSALEPECRPTQMGILQPCKRICKSILEPCSSIIASSEILTMTFDCDSYPDSSDRNVCEDPTRRSQCYDTEFKCLDSTCIPLQWKCDNIKDCSLGEDEENCKFCEHDEFRCQTTDKCIPDKWKCDQYNDCPDGSDENDCYEYEDDAESLGDEYDFSSPRIYSFASVQSPNSPNSRPYITISEEDRIRDEAAYEDTEDEQFLPTAPDNNAAYTKDNETADGLKDKEEIQNGEASGRVLVGVPKSIANFQDSKETMMTSDSERDYKYSSRNQTTSTTTTTTARIENDSEPNADVSTTSTTLSDQYHPTMYCPDKELRCVSGKCIKVSQICDKTVDCPDGADEAMCVYKD